MNLEPKPPVRIPSCVSAQLRLMGGSQVNPGCSEELSVSQLAWEGLNKLVGPVEVLLQHNMSASTRLPLGYLAPLSQRRSVDGVLSNAVNIWNLRVPKKLTSNDPNAQTVHCVLKTMSQKKHCQLCQTHPNITIKNGHFQRTLKQTITDSAGTRRCRLQLIQSVPT